MYLSVVRVDEQRKNAASPASFPSLKNHADPHPRYHFREYMDVNRSRGGEETVPGFHENPFFFPFLFFICQYILFLDVFFPQPPLLGSHRSIRDSGWWGFGEVAFGFWNPPIRRERKGKTFEIKIFACY